MAETFLREITLRGARGSLVWGYRPAATIGAFVVERRRDDSTKPWEWQLRATLTGAHDSFALRQRPLLFSSPRKGGFFCFPVQRLLVHDASTPIKVTATLGPPDY